MLLLVIHTLLLAASAWVHSPTRDEWGHLPAGISHWQLGQFDLYRVNPPLVRMVAALPVLPYAPQIEWPGVPADPRERGASAAGVVLGLAQLTKFTWVFLFGLWPLLWLVWRLRYRVPRLGETRPRGPASPRPGAHAGRTCTLGKPGSLG